MKGRPAMLRSAFGTRSVMGRSRVAKPPASMATGSMVRRERPWCLQRQNKTPFLPPRFRHPFAQPVSVRGIEHQEATAPCADQFAANCTIPHAQRVPLIDLRVADAVGAALLVLPVLMHQLAELLEIAGFQGFLAAVSQGLHPV